MSTSQSAKFNSPGDTHVSKTAVSPVPGQGSDCPGRHRDYGFHDTDADIYQQFQKRKTSCLLKILGTLYGVFKIDFEMNL